MNSRSVALLCSLASVSLATIAGCAAPASANDEPSATSDSALRGVTAGAKVSVTAGGPLRLDFVVKITMPDGRVVWDNTGGSRLHLAESQGGAITRSTGLPLTFSSGKYTRCVVGSTATLCALGARNARASSAIDPSAATRKTATVPFSDAA